MPHRLVSFLLLTLASLTGVTQGATVTLPPATNAAGYVCRLIINEVPFPGEKGYRSEADTLTAMNSLLHVLDSRLQHVPPPYTQQNVAAVTTRNIVDIITAGGTRGQFEGFHRDTAGHPAMAPRVTARINNLLTISRQGQPGKFTRLLNHAVNISTNYMQGKFAEANVHATLQEVGALPVTGRAYSWMTDETRFRPGGNFVRIPDRNFGALGGNRFFTLRKQPN
jgi:hypothetical protein